MDTKTIKVIYNALKNCREYFEKMAEFDESDCFFNQILKKVKSFFTRKQLFETCKDKYIYLAKENVRFYFEEIDPISFAEVALMAVLCNSNIEIFIKNENYFATNELTLSLINKTSAYYGFNGLISLTKAEKRVNAKCENGKVYVLRKSRKFSRLSQKDLLVLSDSEDKK